MTAAPGTKTSRPTLVYIYGPPAVGKLTVAGKLAAITGYPLFHNHLTVNAVNSVFEFGTEPYNEVLHRLRLDVFRVAARSGTSLIFTNNSAWSGADPRRRFVAFASQARQAVEDEGGRALFVRLTAPLPVLEERVADETRLAHRKLVDVHRLRELVRAIDQSPIHQDDLTIDTSVIDPEEAAKTIERHLQQDGE